ncbi:DUF4279 domain-containing protein [Marinobacterium sp. BA1]|uniref:DUF4279 domain-containing protein n=1 Tax=Marinobacterium sp. BA1 TaxID=3138931 RepID=UPI0034E862DB
MSSKTLKIVFLGSKLDPNNVTNTLGITPTDSYEKGFQRIRNGKKSKPRNVGMWCYKSEITSPLEDELDSLLAMFEELSATSIHEADRSSLHIYLGLSNDESVIESSFDFSISQKTLNKIIKMGLDLRVTIN